MECGGTTSGLSCLRFCRYELGDSMGKAEHVQLLGDSCADSWDVQLLGNSCADSWNVQLLDFVASLPQSPVRIDRVSSC